MNDFSDIPFHIRPGEPFEIGSYTFEKTDVVTFATAWDPQPFHTDEEAAKSSLLGGLCASGWHTVSIWMKLQRAHLERRLEELSKQGVKGPEFGPSPGIKRLKWIRPVMVGDTITYINQVLGLRASNSKPGWHIMNSMISAVNQNKEPVMSFESSVFLRLGEEK